MVQERARIIMSCNGCRVLRKGCNETCALRPCLEWIERPEAQGYATLFLAKFYGRAGLLEFITAVPLSQRTALFQSLLYEACGRTVNPVYGAVGLLWSGKWHICQEAVETILNGGNLLTNVMCSHDTIYHNSNVPNPNPLAHLRSSHFNLTSMATHSHLFEKPSTSSFQSQSCLMPNIPSKPSILPPSIQTLEKQVSFNCSHKKLKISTDNLDSRSFIFQSRPREGVVACSYTTNTKHHQNIITSCNNHTIARHTKVLGSIANHHDMGKCFSNKTTEEHLALTLNTSKKREEPINCKEENVDGKVSSSSESSVVTSLRSPLFPSTSCHYLSVSPSNRPHQDMKLLNLLV